MSNETQVTFAQEDLAKAGWKVVNTSALSEGLAASSDYAAAMENPTRPEAEHYTRHVRRGLRLDQETLVIQPGGETIFYQRERAGLLVTMNYGFSTAGHEMRRIVFEATKTGRERGVNQLAVTKTIDLDHQGDHVIEQEPSATHIMLLWRGVEQTGGFAWWDMRRVLLRPMGIADLIHPQQMPNMGNVMRRLVLNK